MGKLRTCLHQQDMMRAKGFGRKHKVELVMGLCSSAPIPLDIEILFRIFACDALSLLYVEKECLEKCYRK